MATDNRTSRHDEDGSPFRGRDADEPIVAADLELFGEAITAKITRELDRRDRHAAHRDRLAGPPAPAAEQAAQPDLASVAARLGVSEQTLSRSIAEAKALELVELLEPHIDEAVRRCLPDALDELLDADDDEVKPNGSPRKAAPKAAKAAGNGKQPRPAPDSEPVGSLHWTERGLWG